MNAQANRRIWRHEGGAEAVEIIALIAVCLALLAVIGLSFNARGGDLGAAAVETLTRFTSRQSTGVQPPDIQVPDIQTPDIAVPVIGVPSIVVNPPQTLLPTVPTQPQQGSGNPLVDFWNSLPDWAKGALISAGFAVLVCAVVVALVALGVITALSMTVVLIASAIAIALAAIGGAIYVLWTGRVDVGALALIGISVPLLVFGLAWLGASGTLTAALTWIRTIALPWVGSQMVRFWQWLVKHHEQANKVLKELFLKYWWLYVVVQDLLPRLIEEWTKGSGIGVTLVLLLTTAFVALAKRSLVLGLIATFLFAVGKGWLGKNKDWVERWLQDRWNELTQWWQSTWQSIADWYRHQKQQPGWGWLP